MMVPFIVTLFLDKIVFVILEKIYRRYAAKKSTGDELGIIVQHKINRVFKHSNNDNEVFRQLLLCVTHRGENTVLGGWQKRSSFNSV